MDVFVEIAITEEYADEHDGIENIKLTGDYNLNGNFRKNGTILMGIHVSIIGKRIFQWREK
jgi:hypothetical protein